MDVAAQAIQLRNDDRSLDAVGVSESCGELRSPLDRVAAFAGLDLGEGVDDHEAVGLGEAGDGVALRFQPEPGLALLLCGDTNVGDGRLHGVAYPCGCGFRTPRRTLRCYHRRPYGSMRDVLRPVYLWLVCHSGARVRLRPSCDGIPSRFVHVGDRVGHDLLVTRGLDLDGLVDWD